MWSLVPFNLRTILILLPSLLVGYIYTLLQYGDYKTAGFISFAESTLASAPVLLGILFIADRLFNLWGLTHRIPWMEQWYPELSGYWTGIIPARNNGYPSSDTILHMRIHQHWFGIKVDTSSDSSYSKSDTTTLHTRPAIEDGIHVLWMNYKGNVLNPEPTDTSFYYGTSRAVYNPVTRELSVKYWTDRAWNQEKRPNTSGAFTLKRISDNPNDKISRKLP